jgi:hypothetical protein
MDELEQLVPAGVELALGGETLKILPLPVGLMPAFLRAVLPVLQQLRAPEIDWLALLAERGEDLLAAVAIAVGKPRPWVDGLSADEAVLLAAKVVEVNADFFTHRVIPRIEALFARLPKAAAGSTPSSA